MYSETYENRYLEDFHMDHNDYVSEIEDITDIISLSAGSLLYRHIAPYLRKQNYRKAIDQMNLWYSNLIVSLKNPESLNQREKQVIKDMQYYLSKNDGKLTGKYEYRKRKTAQEIQAYKDVVLKNKMTILAYKPEIDELMNLYKTELNNKLSKIEELNNQVRKQYVKDWGKVFYTCECGIETQRVNKAHHEKTLKHINWVKENKPDENIVICPPESSWHKKKYKCSCGKEVINANKFNHEKTKYHQLHQLTPDDTPTNDVIYNTGNIQLTIQEIGEKSVSKEGDKSCGSYDKALKEFYYL